MEVDKNITTRRWVGCRKLAQIPVLCEAFMCLATRCLPRVTSQDRFASRQSRSFIVQADHLGREGECLYVTEGEGRSS